VDRAHPRDARVQGDQQIEALLLTDFTNHNPLRGI
jgi:hypothetical protein